MYLRSLSALLLCTAAGGCAPSADPGRSGPQERYAFVTRSETAGQQASTPSASESYLLEPLDGSGGLTRFELFHSETEARRSGGDVYRLVLRARGAAPTPTHAVFAEWQLESAASAPLFEQSRKDLFSSRADHLESFHSDLLLQSLTDPLRYLVLGLYGSEEGLSEARAHPRIHTFAEHNPPARFGARDLYGVRNFRVVPP